jgi:predicted dehydrogenase
MRGRPTVALCGAGAIAGAHGVVARLLGLEVVAVASRSAASAERRAAEFGGRAVAYEDLPAGADITVVSTPPPNHATDAARVLLAGGAVVLETPIATTLADADVLVKATAATGRLLYAENLAYAPVVQAMLARVSRLGTLTSLEVRALAPRPTWGGYTEPWWGGGALFDLGAHPLALALLLAAPAAVVSVHARVEQPEDLQTDDHAEVTLHFDSGLQARVAASWRGGPVPVWDAQAASATGVLRAELLPDPLLEHNGDPVPLPPVRAAVRELPQLEQYGYLGQLEAFVADMAAGRSPRAGAALGRAVLEVTCAAYASAGQGGAAVAIPFPGPRDHTPWELWHGL